jgi:TPR repeat protein
MNKSANIFNLMDRLLPKPELVELASPNELQRLYAGIGMPALRVEELSGPGLVTYQDYKEANPLRVLDDPDEILKRYSELRVHALEGDEDALNDLGWLWVNGLKLKRDLPLARRLFKIAMDQGSAEAVFNLGEMAYYGKAQPVDLNRAVGYYELAYDSGIGCAARALGDIYEEGGEVVSVDLPKAVSWYKLAAADDDLMACVSLGRLLLNRHSSLYDPAVGLYWTQWAAMKGCVSATELLFDFYYCTFDNPPDPDRRLYGFWLDLAISQGSTQAMEWKAADDAFVLGKRA